MIYERNIPIIIISTLLLYSVLNFVFIQSNLLTALKLKFHLISHVHSLGRHSIGHCITSGLLIMQHNNYLEFVLVVFYHLLCNQCGSLYIKKHRAQSIK